MSQLPLGELTISLFYRHLLNLNTRLILPANRFCRLRSNALSRRKYEAFAKLAFKIHTSSLECTFRWLLETKYPEISLKKCSLRGGTLWPMLNVDRIHPQPEHQLGQDGSMKNKELFSTPILQRGFGLSVWVDHPLDPRSFVELPILLISTGELALGAEQLGIIFS